MVPRPNNPGVRLDEINKIIRDLDTGSQAPQEMAKLDAQAGLADPRQKCSSSTSSQLLENPVTQGILSDSVLAEQLVEQARQYEPKW